MPVSVLKVDVQDDKFKAFLASFDKYNKLVEKMPQAFKESNKGAEATLKSLGPTLEAMEGMNKAMKALTLELEGQLAANNDNEESLGRQNKLLEKQQATVEKTRGIIKSSLAAVDHIGASITDTLKTMATMAAETGPVGLALAALTATVLAGVAAVEAGAKVARGVGTERKDALGLGIGANTLSAEKTNLGRYTDVEGVLGTLNSMKHDLRGQAWLKAAGVDPNADTATMLNRLLPIARQRYLAGGQTTQGVMGYGLDKIFDTETLNRLAQEKPEDLQKAIAEAQRQAGKLDSILPDSQQKKLQDFAVTVDNANKVLEDAFIRPLNLAVPALTSMTDAATKAALALYGVAPGRPPGTPSRPPPGPPPGKPTSHPGLIDQAKGVAGKAFDYAKGLAAAASRYAVDGAFLDAIFGAETSHGKNIRTSSAGAQGAMQFMPKTAKAYGVDVNDPYSSFMGSASMVADLKREFHNDMAKVAAAYNWGSGNVEKDVKKHGVDWLRYAPKETQDYVGKVAHVHVTITPAAGSNIVTSARQAAVGP